VFSLTDKTFFWELATLVEVAVESDGFPQSHKLLKHRREDENGRVITSEIQNRFRKSAAMWAW
jgi:hypothetical protein